MSNSSTRRSIAILCQGAAELAGATQVEAARVWEIIAPANAPESVPEFVLLIRSTLEAIRGQGQGDGDGDSPPVGAWMRAPDGSVYLRVGWHDPNRGVVTGWHLRGWGVIQGNPPGYPGGYVRISVADAIGA